MAYDNPGKESRENSQSGSDSRRKEWQRPVLHHLAAKEARGGGNPHNDGQPGNPTPGGANHS